MSEAIGLNVGDVAFGTPTMLLVRRQSYPGTMTRLKTRNGRRDLPLPSDLARSLWTITQGRDPDAPLFSTRTGTRLSDANLRKRALHPAGAAAGVPWIGFHTFRHSCASRLLAGGKNIAQVSKWLGRDRRRDDLRFLSVGTRVADNGRDVGGLPAHPRRSVAVPRLAVRYGRAMTE